MAKRDNLIYDLPTRLFHWLYVSFFAIAFIIAKSISVESPKFRYHMLAGLMLGLLLIFRIVWGIIGSKHARFRHFNLNPKHLISYFKSLLKTGTEKFAGHNPASSWAALGMIFGAIGIVITGILMGWNKEAYSEIHEIFVYLTLAIATSHVMGLLIHTLTHKDAIGLSMLDGKKEVGTESVIPHSYRVAAIVMIVLLLAQGAQMYKSFDAKEGKVSLWGVTLQLGENEKEDKD